MEISSSLLAHQVLKTKLTADVEEFWVLTLSSSLRMIDCKMLFRGTVDACQVHPRDVFRFAFSSNASRIILAHNHPSGDSSPSESDIEITNRLIDIGYLMQVPVVDHLILVTDSFRSLADFSDCDFSLNRKRRKLLMSSLANRA